MLKIAVTGGIASGKSATLALLGEHMPTLDVDKMVDECYADPAISARIKDALGTSERKALAGIVFADRHKRKLLEGLLHPEVEKRLLSWMKEQKEKGEKAVAVEVPLLFEAGWEKHFDKVVTAYVSPATQEARLKERGLSPQEIEQRIGSQLPDEVKASRAHGVVSGDNPEAAKRAVDTLLKGWGI